MSSFVFILRSLRCNRIIHALTAMMVALATALLVGSLVFGHSMRGSLRDLALHRLGKIDSALLSDRFFDPGFLTDRPNDLPEPFISGLPAIILPVVAVMEKNGKIDKHVGDAQVMTFDLVEGGFAINGAMADQLGMTEPGGEFLLCVEKPYTINPDSALGQRQDTMLRIPVTVQKIVHGRDFLLEVNQSPRPTVYLPLAWLQEHLGLPNRVNTILFLTKERQTVSTVAERRQLLRTLRPSLADLGIVVDNDQGFLHVKSARSLFTDREAAVLRQGLEADAFPYLVNIVDNLYSAKRETHVPYSFLCAIDYPFGDFRLGDEEILINEWLTREMQIQISDIVEVTYFEPDSLRGQTRTKTALFTVAGVIPLEDVAADSRLVPEIPGITDRPSMADWQTPFPFDPERVRPADEVYWKRHHALPKAFISMAAGRKLWESRFGTTSGFLLPVESGILCLPHLEETACDPEGPFFFSLRPLKEIALAASVGTIPFYLPALLMSLFGIIAALILIALLVRLELDCRERSFGILLTLGFSREQLIRWLIAEWVVVVIVGVLFGIPLGIFHAWLLVEAVNTCWINIVPVPFVTLHPGLPEILLGAAGGFVLSLAVIPKAIRSRMGHPVRSLLSGSANPLPMPAGPPTMQENRLRIITILLIALMLVWLLFRGVEQQDETMQIVFFFGAGMLLSLLGLARLQYRFRYNTAEITSIAALAISNIRRQPMCALITAGLVSQSIFLILALSAFRFDGSVANNDLSDGTGGFAIVLETSLTVHYDIALQQGRQAVGFSGDDAQLIEYGKIQVYSIRVREGDEANPANLYRPQQPRILGIPHHFRKRGGFRFAATLDPEVANPWMLLNDEAPDDCVPVILDLATAYALKLESGVGQIFEIDGIRCRVVGLLVNSIFQGDVLMADFRFRELFPEINGFRFFLVEDQPTHPDVTRWREDIIVRTALRERDLQAVFARTLAIYGLQDETARERLERFYRTQNAFLSSFQCLGTLGLSLGLFGFTVIQIRNFRHRRGELATMHAFGFKPYAISLLACFEGLYLLFQSMMIGFAAAALAILPMLKSRPIILESAGTFALLMLVLLGVGLFVNAIAAFVAGKSVRSGILWWEATR